MASKDEEYDYQIVGKQNLNEDTQSRIEINTMENESMIVNEGDVKDELDNTIQMLH